MLTTELNRTTELAESRSAVYRFLTAALAYPDGDQLAWMRGDTFRDGLRLLCEQFGTPPAQGELVPDNLSDHESRYLACFEVGFPRPPVPLLASHYNRREPVPATIHEHVLFYKRFGVRMAVGNPEPADHLRNELAFLIHLDALLTTSDGDGQSILLARHDFLTRQLGRWCGLAADEAEEKGLPMVYQCLLRVLASAVAEDLAYCQESLATAIPEK